MFFKKKKISTADELRAYRELKDKVQELQLKAQFNEATLELLKAKAVAEVAEHKAKWEHDSHHWMHETEEVQYERLERFVFEILAKITESSNCCCRNKEKNKEKAGE